MESPASAQASTRLLIPGIDLVRFAAAFMVMLFHYGFFFWNERNFTTGIHPVADLTPGFPEIAPLAWWGWVGVEIFFVISGFVIAISSEGRTAGTFFRARFLRLTPALWFFASLAFITSLFFAAIPFSDLLVYYLKSIVLWPKGPWLDGVYWTLTVEVAFYGVIFLLLAANRFRWLVPFTYVWGTITSFFWFVCLLDLLHLLPASLSEIVLHLRWAHFYKVLLLSTGSYFVVGLMLYLIFRRGPSVARVAMLATSVLASEIGIYAFGKSMIETYQIDGHAQTPCLVWLLALAVIAASIYWARHSANLMTPRTATLVRNIGLTTYPLYLFHVVSGGFLFRFLLETGFNKYAMLLTAMTFAIAFSYAFAVGAERLIRTALATAYDAGGSIAESLRKGLPNTTTAKQQTIPLSSQIEEDR